MEAQGARVVRHVLTCPVTRGQVAYDACSSCVSHVGVREAGVVRHLLTCRCHKGAGGVRRLLHIDSACRLCLFHHVLRVFHVRSQECNRLSPVSIPPRASRAPREECNRLSHVSTPPRAPRAPREGV